MEAASDRVAAAREAVTRRRHWYHTIELAPGVVTPGVVDLRPFVPQVLPDDLSGRRCLDVGAFDGFWAFEMERRGATVHALNLPDWRQGDLPPNTREHIEQLGLESPDGGFRIAREALGSRVRAVAANVYDLGPELMGGPVDVILCGALLQHLRDPVGALESMGRTLGPGGELILVESVAAKLGGRHDRHRPLAEFRPGVPGSIFTWWLPNLAGLRALATTAGFAEVVQRLPPRFRPPTAERGHELVALRFRPRPGQAPGAT